MWQRRRAWPLLFALTGVMLAVYFEPTRCVRGWLWGEAFFDGRPTSYWRSIVVHDLQTDPREFVAAIFAPPPPTWWERVNESVGIKPRVASSFHLLTHAAADGVVRELSQDENERVAGFAKDVFDRGGPIDFVCGNGLEYFGWLQLICKHHREPQDYTKLMGPW
jgi:hypothetical protein